MAPIAVFLPFSRLPNVSPSAPLTWPNGRDLSSVPGAMIALSSPSRTRCHFEIDVTPEDLATGIELGCIGALVDQMARAFCSPSVCGLADGGSVIGSRPCGATMGST